MMCVYTSKSISRHILAIFALLINHSQYRQNLVTAKHKWFTLMKPFWKEISIRKEFAHREQIIPLALRSK